MVTPHIPLVCVVGRPDRSVILQALADAGETGAHLPVLAVEPDTADLVARTLRGWRRGVALLHTRSGPLPPAPRAVEVRWSEPASPIAAAALDALPGALRNEILDAAVREPVAYVSVDDAAVAFCHAPWRTERWFDISVETVAPWERRGFALACARALIERLESEGLGAVWGAHEKNDASLGLAARLGFRPVARVSIFERPDADGL